MSTHDEVQKVLELAADLARRAGEIQRDRYETTLDIQTKSASIDLVTEVDRECEAISRLLCHGVSLLKGNGNATH